MIQRHQHIEALRARLSSSPVVAIIGARQVGKTTIARAIHDSWDGTASFFDLENPTDLARLSDPLLALEPLEGLVVLDEIQRVPDLFTILRVLVDRPDHPARFLVLGSASPDLLRQSSESLAGRISYYEMSGFRLGETGAETADTLWSRGGFPRSFLADDDDRSDRWRRDFTGTYLERDLPNLGINLPPGTLRRFWTMLAHSHGQVWSASRIGASLGVAHTTVRRYLDVLCDTFMARSLPPYIANTGKRQVKSPKVYLRDSGLLHTLLGIRTLEELGGHPVLGASWEGFAMEQVIERLGADDGDCFFWGVHGGAEIDLVVADGPRLRGFEFKRSLSPSLTRSLTSAVETLGLDETTIVYPGRESYPLAESVTATPLTFFAG